MEPYIPPGALSIDLYPFEPDVFLCQRGREEGQGFGDPAVQPLARVIGAYVKLLQNMRLL